MTDTLLSDKIVLVVEDEPRNAALIVAMLNIAGITKLKVCKAGHEILLTIQETPQIDLLLLDLQLPGEDGYQIFQRLRLEPVLKRTPIVAVTAQVMPDDVARAEAIGLDGFLGKPLVFDRFPLQIRRLLTGERVWEPR